MTTYLASQQQLILVDFNTACTKLECEEAGCSFPNCSVDLICCFTEQAYEQKIKALKADGHTINNVSSI